MTFWANILWSKNQETHLYEKAISLFSCYAFHYIPSPWYLCCAVNGALPYPQVVWISNTIGITQLTQVATILIWTKVVWITLDFNETLYFTTLCCLCSRCADHVIQESLVCNWLFKLLCYAWNYLNFTTPNNYQLLISKNCKKFLVFLYGFFINRKVSILVNSETITIKVKKSDEKQ